MRDAMFPTCLFIRRTLLGALSCCAAMAAVMAGARPATASQDIGMPNGTIAYAMVSLYWGIHQTPDGKQECPQGLNILGPREQFKVMFPDNGHERNLADTQLKYEIDTFFPSTEPDRFPYHDAGGAVAPGMNLDDEVGPNDFTSPEGEQGIDNQLFRAIGCNPIYRGPEGPFYYYDSRHVVTERYNRTLVEVKGIDSLVDDNDVQVNIFRGLDRLLTDATGETVMPGGSQRIDTKFGAKFIQHLRGRIVDGVLTTEPTTIIFPFATFGTPMDITMKAARIRMKLGPEKAQSLIGGYVDVEDWYSQIVRSKPTHHQSYGQLSSPSLYKALRRLADAYADPKTGANTAISTAIQSDFVQVFLVRPPSTLATAPSHGRIMHVQEALGRQKADDGRR